MRRGKSGRGKETGMERRGEGREKRERERERSY